MNLIEYANTLAAAGERWALLGMAQRYEGKSYVQPAFAEPEDLALRERDALVLQVADRLARTGWSAAYPCTQAGSKGEKCHNQAVGDIVNMVRAAVQIGLDEVIDGKSYEPATDAVAGAWITTVSDAWKTWAGDHDAVRASVHRAAKNQPKVQLPPKQEEQTPVVLDPSLDVPSAPDLNQPAHQPPSTLQILGSLLLGVGGLVAIGLAASKQGGPIKRNPSWKGPSWRDFIRGEWWLIDGEELFADQDVGDQGHESIAIDYMLDKDRLIEGLREQLEKEAEGDDESRAIQAQERLEELEQYENDEYGASGVYFNESIPDDVGPSAVTVSSKTSKASVQQVWEDLEQDIRSAFAKHYGAVMAHDRDFTAWKVDDGVLDRIRDFILGQAAEHGEGEPDDPDTEIGIEEASRNRIARIPVARFLTIRHPRDLWDPNVETQELWDSVTQNRDEQP